MGQAFKVQGLKECCAEPRVMVNESFSYEVSFTEDGKLFIDTNDYCTDGFEGMECMNCGKQYDVQSMINTGQVEH